MIWADLDPGVIDHGLFVWWIVSGYAAARFVPWIGRKS